MTVPDEKKPKDDGRHPWKEAVVILSAMIFVAVVTLNYAIRKLNETNMLNRSQRIDRLPTAEQGPRPFANTQDDLKKSIPESKQPSRPSLKEDGPVNQ